MENQGFEDKMRAESRFKAVEERLARLEKLLERAFPSETAALKAPPLPPARPPATPPPPPLQPISASHLAGAGAALRGATGNWLGAVAVLCFMLAAGFIIKLSLDSGWLTPVRQIGIAAMLGFGLVGVGLSLLESDREYASFLPAAGIIVLYAAVFGGHRLYSIITFEHAVSLSVGVSGLCIWLYTRVREDIYPVTAALGAYCAPAVLGLGAAAVFSVYYYLLCSLTFAVISIWVRSRTLTLVAAYLAMLMTAFTGLDLGRDALIVAMLALNFVALSGGIYLYTVNNGTPLTERESMALLPALLFFYAMEYFFIDRLLPGKAPWFSLGFAGLLLALYLAAKRRFPEGQVGSGSMVLAFVTVVCFHSFYLELLPKDGRPWLFVAIVVGLCFLPRGAFGSAGKEGPLRIPAFGALAVLLLEFLSMASKLLSGAEGSWLAVSVFSVAALWVLIAFRGEELEGSDGYAPLLGAAHLLAVLALYRLTKDESSLYVSISWLVYATSIIGFAYSRRDPEMARSAVFVLAFAAAKALLYDAAAAPTVVRILCLLFTGAALYGSGFFLRRISGWKAEKGPQA
ncbi:MAG: DUF2339 domain-containing protein [Elusimicrobiales bacterium]